MKIKAIIFDLDGTVADTLPSICEAGNMANAALGYPQRTREDVLPLISFGIRDLVRSQIPEYARDEENIDRVFEIFADAYRKTYLHADKCYDGVKEAMEKLSERYLLGMNSNKADDMVGEMIKLLLKPGTVSAYRGVVPGVPVKPDPAGAFAVCEALGVRPEECVYVGDSEFDLATGRNAGMYPISVTWGYRTEEELRKFGAEHIARTPEELLDAIEKLDREGDKL